MRPITHLVIASLCAAVLAAVPVPSTAQISVGGAPKADKHRRKAAEGFAPLPLPVTPLRRTEKKRPPAPPTLMAKINYGAVALVNAQGERSGDMTTPGETKDIFRFARAVLGVNYKGEVLTLGQFNYAPERVPIMYFSGREALRFSPELKANLRRYVEQGGTIFGDMSNGSEAFARSFASEMQSLFPERPWHTLPADHPLFSSHFPINHLDVSWKGQDRKQQPHFEGINVGFRTAILFSPYGVDYGWNDSTKPNAPLVSLQESRRIGVNLLAYTLAYYRLGRMQSVATVFREAQPGPDEIVIAQIRHNGDWDPDPSGLSFLLRAVREQTTGDVQFRRVAIDPENADLFAYPFLYLTGQLDFNLTKTARANLRSYLERGGFLLVVNAAHRVDFDRAVRRELKAILPGRSLETLAEDHPLFTVHHNLSSAPSLNAAANGKPRFGARCEGIDIDGVTSVIYSPLGLGAGWQDAALPFVPTPDRNYALGLGVNTVVYAMTH